MEFVCNSKNTVKPFNSFFFNFNTNEEQNQRS